MENFFELCVKLNNTVNNPLKLIDGVILHVLTPGTKYVFQTGKGTMNKYNFIDEMSRKLPNLNPNIPVVIWPHTYAEPHEQPMSLCKSECDHENMNSLGVVSFGTRVLQKYCDLMQHHQHPNFLSILEAVSQQIPPCDMQNVDFGFNPWLFF